MIFTLKDVIGKLQAAAAAAQQQALSAQQAILAEPVQEQAPVQQIPLENPEARQDAAQIPQAPTPPSPAPSAETPAQGSCPRPLLPVLNACPPCTPADCFCADGKKLTLEDQASAYQVLSTGQRRYTSTEFLMLHSFFLVSRMEALL